MPPETARRFSLNLLLEKESGGGEGIVEKFEEHKRSSAKGCIG